MNHLSAIAQLWLSSSPSSISASSIQHSAYNIQHSAFSKQQQRLESPFSHCTALAQLKSKFKFRIQHSAFSIQHSTFSIQQAKTKIDVTFQPLHSSGSAQAQVRCLCRQSSTQRWWIENLWTNYYPTKIRARFLTDCSPGGSCKVSLQPFQHLRRGKSRRGEGQDPVKLTLVVRIKMMMMIMMKMMQKLQQWPTWSSAPSVSAVWRSVSREWM